MTVLANGVPYSNYFAHRNLLINSCFRVNQRGISGTPLTGGKYVYDRWLCGSATGTTAVTDYNYGSDIYTPSKLMIITGSANSHRWVLQRVERNNLHGLLGKTVTFSVRVGLTGTSLVTSLDVKLVFGRGDAPDDYSTTGGVETASKTITISKFDTSSISRTQLYQFSKVIDLADVQNGIQVGVIGTMPTGSSIYIEEPQLEVGEVATPFEHRPYGYELSLCQRYFRKDVVMARTPASNFNTFSFPVRMRTTPSISKIGGAGTGGVWNDLAGGGGIYQSAAHSFDALVELAFDAEIY